MAQGLLERVVSEARGDTTPSILAELRATHLVKDLYGVEALASLPKLFPPISLDALRTWRTKDSWPAFAIFTLQLPTFRISYQQRLTSKKKDPISETFIVSPQLPAPIEDCYKDMMLVLRKHAEQFTDMRRHHAYNLTARFQGLIPPEIKIKIKKVKHIFDEIFLIAEPPVWSLERVEDLVIGDPLVVGWNEETQALHLIAEFDTTAVEDALLLEGPANKQK